VFLENILYQANRIKTDKLFTWPVKLESEFFYVTCKDLGSFVAETLVSFDEIIV
jgi:hypothetical protein